MVVILKEFGPVFLNMDDANDRSVVNRWLNLAGSYLRGGNREHDEDYYKTKLAEMAGIRVRGTIIGGKFDSKSGTFEIEADAAMIWDHANRAAALAAID